VGIPSLLEKFPPQWKFDHVYLSSNVQFLFILCTLQSALEILLVLPGLRNIFMEQMNKKFRSGLCINWFFKFCGKLKLALSLSFVSCFSEFQIVSNVCGVFDICCLVSLLQLAQLRCACFKHICKMLFGYLWSGFNSLDARKVYAYSLCILAARELIIQAFPRTFQNHLASFYRSYSTVFTSHRNWKKLKKQQNKQ